MRILFLCTGNSCRSQMAEAFARRIGGGSVEVASAGTKPAEEVNPLAVRAMAERGVFMQGAYPKTPEMALGPWGWSADLVVTVCSRARESCPTLPGVPTEHWDLPDPADAQGSEEERLAVFRSVRDDIDRRVRALLAAEGPEGK